MTVSALTSQAQFSTNAFQGFDGANVNSDTELGYDGTPSLTRASDQSGSSERPARQNFYTSYSQAWYIQGATETVLFRPRYFKAGSTNFIRFRLAAWSLSNPNNGVDNDDFVQVFVSVNGSNTFYNTLEVRGNSGNYWNYNSSSPQKVPYTGSGTPTPFQPTGSGDAENNNFSNFEINLPSTVSQVRFYIVASTNGVNERWTIDDVQIGSSAPLPVELKSFMAEAAPKGTQLKWATASEKNNAAFEIQRSSTPNEFTTIGRVAGQGTSSRTHNYEWLDAQPLSGLSYYRLRQLDTDGTESFSPVAIVQHKEGLAAGAFFPNPTTGQVTLNAALGAVKYRVLNALGQTVLTGEAQGGSTVDMQSLRTGAYFLELQSASGRTVQRFMREL